MSTTVMSTDVIVQEVTIHARAEKIFDALTNPAELVKWWGAQSRFRLLHAECDVCVGGAWKMVSTNCEIPGATNEVVGEYRTIERPNLLIYTWLRRQEGFPETVVRWDLKEENGHTHVRLTHSGLNTDELKARHSGWPVVVAALRQYLEN